MVSRSLSVARIRRHYSGKSRKFRNIFVGLLQVYAIVDFLQAKSFPAEKEGHETDIRQKP